MKFIVILTKKLCLKLVISNCMNHPQGILRLWLQGIVTLLKLKVYIHLPSNKVDHKDSRTKKVKLTLL